LASILFPVFGRARESARRSSCLSNTKQISLGFLQYFQDYDERFPQHKNTEDNTELAWAQGSMQPYLKSRQILRCPSDNSTQWTPDSTGKVRVTSYALNGLFHAESTPISPATALADLKRSHIGAIQTPAEVILMAESPEINNWERNYVHIFLWSPTGVYSAAADRAGCTNNGFKGADFRHCLRPDGKFVPEDIATERHFGGYNVAYLDGHSKWVRHEQAYRVEEAPDGGTVKLQGQFDPRR
jgi:prepilin-type processing-associated H-X9-DG protein